MKLKEVCEKTGLNIPAAGYRQSGNLETAVLEKWEPAFRRNGNRGRCRRILDRFYWVATPREHLPVAE